VVINRAGLYALACFFASAFLRRSEVRRPIMSSVAPRWFYAKALSPSLFRCASQAAHGPSHATTKHLCVIVFLSGVAISHLHPKVRLKFRQFCAVLASGKSCASPNAISVSSDCWFVPRRTDF
jgi:hypothetical protein